MLIELMPLLGERAVMLTVARIDKNRIRVNVIPTRKRENENAALCATQLQRLSFGKLFSSNPDLPGRIRKGVALSEFNREMFYTFDEIGYTDYSASK